MHVQKGLCDYLTYAVTYALYHVVPRIKLALNASHEIMGCVCVVAAVVT